MGSFGTLTWQLAGAALLTVMGVLLVAAAFSPDNPAPVPAILGSGVLALVAAAFLLRLHLAFMRKLAER